MLIRPGMLAVLAMALAVSSLTAAIVNGLGISTDQADNSGNTFTSAASFCTSGSTGLLDPSANAADTGGNGDGFELNPTDAYADGGGYASNIAGPGDRHRFYDYGVNIASYCAVKGIEVRLDWWVDAIGGSSSVSAELSWDGGSTWTAPYTDTAESKDEHTGLLGGSSDTWGHSWTLNDLSNTSFRVRLTCNCSGGGCSGRSFYLDWVPVNVYYGPP